MKVIVNIATLSLPFRKLLIGPSTLVAGFVRGPLLIVTDLRELHPNDRFATFDWVIIEGKVVEGQGTASGESWINKRPGPDEDSAVDVTNSQIEACGNVVREPQHRLQGNVDDRVASEN